MLGARLHSDSVVELRHNERAVARGVPLCARALQVHIVWRSNGENYEICNDISSGWFDVTVEPHEDQKDIGFQGGSGAIGTAKVWTGTLMNTPDGDLIQAHATVVIEGVRGSASLFMSMDFRLAKSSIVLDSQTASEFLLIPVDFKCERN